MNWWDWMNRRLTGERAKVSRRGLVGGRGLEEWEQGWRRIGLLPSAHMTAPRETIGLFRLLQGGEIVYLGRSHGPNADCLRQTLRGLLHGGSAPLTLLDRQVREQGHELVVEVLITSCSEVASRLEQQWLQLLRPPWNRMESEQSSAYAPRQGR